MEITEVLIRMEQSWVLGSGEGLFDKPAGGSWARKLFLLKMFSHKPLQISTKIRPASFPSAGSGLAAFGEGAVENQLTAHPPRCS